MSKSKKYTQTMMSYRKQYVSTKGHLQLFKTTNIMPGFLAYRYQAFHDKPNIYIFL